MAKERAKSAGKSKLRLTGNTTIGQALTLHPKAATVFKKYGMACTKCGGAHAEPIHKAAEMYGVNPRNIVRDLNKLLSGG